MEGNAPGVPDAMARAIRALEARVEAQFVDRLWLFPPLRTGRRETGVVAAGCFIAGDERRLLVTLAYRAEETGKGISFESHFQEEGEAPRDRLPRIMAGVVHRMDGTPGDPRTVELAGDPAAFRAVLQELDPFEGDSGVGNPPNHVPHSTQLQP